MIWKGIRRKTWEFEQAFAAENSAYISNPARGWYGVYTFRAEERIAPEELKWSLSEGETLSLVLVDVGGFRERPLDLATLENIRKILAFFEQNQRDVIFRPVYDREGKGREREPASFELVLEHLGQLGALLKENPYSVFIFQGFLVGSWGELHDSSYLSEDCLKKMWERLRPGLGETIYGAVRTPAQWRLLVSEEEFQKGNFPRLGLFDDGIFASKSHLGTFGTMTREAAGWKAPWIREEELSFLETLGKGFPLAERRSRRRAQGFLKAGAVLGKRSWQSLGRFGLPISIGPTTGSYWIAGKRKVSWTLWGFIWGTASSFGRRSL